MGRDEILNMPAGREMDALIAEKVMGLRVHIKPERQKVDLGFYRRKIEYRTINWVYAGGYLLRSYSTDISAAWDVVEKLKTIYHMSIWTDYYEDRNNYGCRFQLRGGGQSSYPVISDAAPLAICRAALLATMTKGDD